MDGFVSGWTPPDDRDEVLAAARLGWALAELRGRIRDALGAGPTAPTRPDTVLPLAQERSSREQLIEHFWLVSAAADHLDLNVPAATLTKAMKTPNGPTNKDESTAAWLHETAWSLVKAPDPTGSAALALADTVRQIFYAWDARIQDELAGQPAKSAAYQLGRAVAEIRWGYDLNVEAGADVANSLYLLGPQRGERIDRLLVRLSSHYDPVTLHALEASLPPWRIQDPSKVSPDAEWRAALIEQATIWHDLVTGRRDGASLISSADVLRHPKSLIPIIRALWPEAIAMVVGALLLAGAALAFVSPDIEDQLTPIAAVLGLFGISFASLSARLRTSANDLIDALRQDLYRSLVAQNATVRVGSVPVPAPIDSRPARPAADGDGR